MIPSSSGPPHVRDDRPGVPGRSARAATAWRAVQSEIMRRIATRRYAPGALIPTEQELAAELGCARATVHRALAGLARRGVLERRRRIGTRVSFGMDLGSRMQRPTLREDIEASGRIFGYRFLGGRPDGGGSTVIETLMIADPAHLRETEALILADEVVHCHERRWTNMAVVPGMTDAVLEGIPAADWLARNIALTHAEMRLRAMTAGRAAAAAALDCDPEAPVLVHDSCLWMGPVPVTMVRHVLAPGAEMRDRAR